MKITDIKEKKRNRIVVTIDGEDLNLNARMLIEAYLYVGKEVSKEEVDELLYVSDEKDAMDKAINFIAYQMRTVQEVKNRLKKEEYEYRLIQKIIDRLLEEKYLDDVHFAEEYYRSYRSRYGVFKIVANLKKKGIDDDLIHSLRMEDDVDMAYNSVLKKYDEKLNQMDYALKGKISQYLAQRGFTFETVKKVVNRIEEKIREEL